MLENLTRAVCDNCGDRVRLETGDSLQAGRLLQQRGWCFYDHGYGNESHFCTEACRQVYIQKNGLKKD